jgi:polyribonucleotide nucleotidyltransferase
MAMEKVSMDFGGKTLSIETGRVAKQADGSVWVSYGDTVVLVAVVAAKNVKEGQDFFPLTVDYREKTYSAGKIPGGFFKREGKQKDSEILTCRLIDRPLRPLFPEGYLNEVVISAMVLSSDKENESDIPAMIGASAALSISNIPFAGPIGAARIGRVNGQFVVNPTFKQIEEGDLDMVVAASRDSIMMVEGGSKSITEADFLAAVDLAHAEIRKVVALQEELAKKAGKAKSEVVLKKIDTELDREVRAHATEAMRKALANTDKLQRQEDVAKIKLEALGFILPKFLEKEKDIKAVLENIETELVRQMIAFESKRADGRAMDEIRPITIETGVLPRTHGSSLFTRGQTQALVVATLGTPDDELMAEELEGESWRKYFLHYNFPSFSVGETKPNRGPGRREIGHGNLAERAIQAVLPAYEKFPYTIRVVSEILESNGSSSMASICGGVLSLMDAGVPLSAPVAGIAMGLIKEKDKFVVLTDIQGLEDHFGDMDFKVAGTADAITAIQMDIKIEGLDRAVMAKALEQAKAGRLFILDKMKQALPTHRPALSPYAPQVETFKINPAKIGRLIGPSGKNIKAIQELTKAKIDVQDDGTVSVSAVDGEMLKKAVQMAKDSVAEAEVGKTYLGTVVKITDFGAFVNILPNIDGLVHISQLAKTRVAKVEDVVREQDTIMVKCIEIDEKSGKIRLSRKDALLEREMAQAGN